MTELRDRVIRAHGGAERWAEITDVMASASVGGIEFASRLHFNPLQNVDVHLSVGRPCLSISSYPDTGHTGCYTPQRVWIEGRDGRCASERHEPAAAFKSFRRWLLWDQLDVVYYVGLLLSQTLRLPALLSDPELEVEELSPVLSDGSRWSRLAVRYPDSLAALSSEQVVYADSAGLIRRIDLAQNAYGSLLRVAQFWQGHETCGGVVFPTRCTTHPCLATGQPWRFTTLAWLELSDLNPIARAKSGAL